MPFATSGSVVKLMDLSSPPPRPLPRPWPSSWRDFSPSDSTVLLAVVTCHSVPGSGLNFLASYTPSLSPSSGESLPVLSAARAACCHSRLLPTRSLPCSSVSCSPCSHGSAASFLSRRPDLRFLGLAVGLT